MNQPKQQIKQGRISVVFILACFIVSRHNEYESCRKLRMTGTLSRNKRNFSINSCHHQFFKRVTTVFFERDALPLEESSSGFDFMIDIQIHLLILHLFGTCKPKPFLISQMNECLPSGRNEIFH